MSVTRNRYDNLFCQFQYSHRTYYNNDEHNTTDYQIRNLTAEQFYEHAGQDDSGIDEYVVRGENYTRTNMCLITFGLLEYVQAYGICNERKTRYNYHQ